MIRSLFLLVLLASACTPDLEGTVEIHALPIGLEIIYPITPVNIVEMNSCTGQAEATDPRIQEVMTLLDGAGPGSFYAATTRSEEHTSELQSLMRISYAVFCLKKQKTKTPI